jgi:hypothetical protein
MSKIGGRLRRTRGPSTSPACAASDIIQEILSSRVAVLRSGMNAAAAEALRRSKSLKGDAGRECRTHRIGTSTVLLYPSEAIARKRLPADGDEATGPYRYPELAALLTAVKILNQELIPSLVEVRPSMTRTEIFGLLNKAWPASRGGPSGRKTPPMFPPALLMAAHEALARELSWDSDAVDKELGARLGVSGRTIRKLRSAATRSR